MKRIFLFAALLGVALTSCVKDELTEQPYEQTPIVFEAPVVSPSTKAVSEVPTGYNTSLDFGVWAEYYYADTYTPGGAYNGTAETDNSISKTYMPKVRVAYNRTSWVTYNDQVATPYYWPKNGSLTFMAISPYSVVKNDNISFTKNGIKITGYTVNTDSENQHDLLFSERTYNETNKSTSVPIYFKHALSSIRFSVKADAEYAGTTITVTGIEVVNAYTKANFAQNLDDANNEKTGEISYDSDGYLSNSINETDKGFLWSGHSDPGSYTAYSITKENQNGITLSTTSQYTSGYSNGNSNVTDLILLPQDLRNVSVKVYYTITNPSNIEIEQEGTLNLYQASGVEGDKTRKNEAWARGKRYTYHISIGLNQITFAPEVTDWDNIIVPNGNGTSGV